ncbi:MAG: elongation factor G [bacterium]|nr:elongation factor G [bacterium]MDE0642636.1 elongation factor G [bacterium]MYD05113.1 elongation factor G [Acidimicrobiia bacterium]
MRPENIRNVGLFGHGGSGKTSLAEALLFHAGEINRVGTVDAGNTVMDFEPEEIERQGSLGLSVASFEQNGMRVNLIDTPGYADFIGEALAALRAVDLALFVVSAVDGVEVQTEILWEAARREGVARAVFVNKLDRDRASFARTLDGLTEAFGKRIAPIQIPIGEEGDLKGVVRLVSGRAYSYKPDQTEGSPIEVPAEINQIFEETRSALVESVVETDDDLLEAYFEGEEPSLEKMVEVIHNGMIEGEIFPVLVGSAGALVGIDTLVEFISDFGPTPLERTMPPVAGEQPSVDADGPVLGYTFKTSGDQYVGRVNTFRVFSGSFNSDTVLETQSGQKLKMSSLFSLQGGDHKELAELMTGSIGSVSKLDHLRVGDTLRTPGTPVVMEPVQVPRPVHEVTVTPRSTQDEDKLSTALARVQEEDPTLLVERRAETSETVMSGLGEAHVIATLARISRRFGVKVDTGMPRIPYRETILGRADVEGKHKKQSGGRGQFGVAYVKFEPNGRGEGYEFVDQIKGGSIPRGLIPAVDKGIQEAFERGILADYPVIDVRATVYDGKYHSVDSDELSFRMAGIMAVRAAAPDLRATILEPIVTITIRVSDDYMGDIIGDINARRGRVMGMDADGRSRIVKAEVPLAEVQRYSVDLRSMTGGRGSFELEFARYEPAPPQEVQRVVAASKAED